MTAIGCHFRSELTSDLKTNFYEINPANGLETVYLLPDDANAHGEDTVDFLRQLRRHIPGPMTILWDRGNIHDRSRVVRAYLAGHPEVVTEKLPSYAPETNPDESVWEHTKHGRLANFAPEDTTELRAVLVEEFERLRGRADLLAAFIRHAKVPIRLRC